MKRREMTKAIAAGLMMPFAFCQQHAQAQSQPAAAGRQLRIVPAIAPVAGTRAPAEQDMQAYLFVYFKDETHSVHFATSTDGYTFTDINDGQPVLPGKGLGEQQGVRDPHLMRGPDNAFYMSMTDLHIYARDAGLRSTEWERPGEDYGWGNNRALILMKSYDLVNWTHALVRIDQLFPADYADVGAAWAPQTIFDAEKNQLMVYFTTRHKGGQNYLVYAYANAAYTTLETTPQQLFHYPDQTKSTIDGDITRVGNKYHLFYVAHDAPNGLRHAVSDRINTGYQFDPRKIDPETVACEAPMVWRRIGSKNYVLMYDVFGLKPNNMGFSETADFTTFKNLGRFNDPGSAMRATNFSGPKHGSVMHITAAELARLKAHFARA